MNFSAEASRSNINNLPNGHIILNGSGTSLKRRLSSLSKLAPDDEAKKCRNCGQKSAIKRAGPYLLGPRLGNSPVRSIVQCLARKEGTNEFYSIKLLTLEEPGKDTQDGRQGKMLLHTEYSLLSLLHDQPGVVHHHGMFQDEILDDHIQETIKSKDDQQMSVHMPRIRRRLCLVLDCLSAHDYANSTADLINLQHYVIREKKLTERESVMIFHDIVKVVESLHQVVTGIFPTLEFFGNKFNWKDNYHQFLKLIRFTNFEILLYTHMCIPSGISNHILALLCMLILLHNIAFCCPMND